MIELPVRVNGMKFGLASPRADEEGAGDPYRQANISYSLVQARDHMGRAQGIVTPSR